MSCFFRCRLLGVVLLALVLLASTPAPGRADVVADANRAVQAQADGELGLAMELYTRILDSGEVHPGEGLYSYLLINRALIHKTRGQTEQALVDLDKSIAAKPDHAAFFNRGIIRVEQNRREEALADFDRAIELNPRYAKAYRERGELLLRMNQAERGRADLNKARELELKIEFQ